MLARKRQARTTQREYEEMYHFVEQNRVLLNGKTKPQEANKINSLWQSFANSINAKGLGPPRTAEKWRKIFNEWKVNTRRKTREIKISLTGTGGGPASKKDLTDLEERLLALISMIHLGDEDIIDSLGGSEQGLLNQDQENFSMAANIQPETGNNSPGEIAEIEYYVEQHDDDVSSNNITATPILTQVGPEGQETKRKLCFGSMLSQKKELKNKHVPQQRYTSSILESACTSFNDAQKTKLEASQNKAKALNNLAQALERQNELQDKALKLKEEELKILKVIAKAKYQKAFGSLEGFEV